MTDMNDGPTDLALRYVEGELDAQELARFEEALLSDPELRAEVDAARQVITVLRSLGEEDLRGSLREADAELSHSPKAALPRSRNTWWRWAAAAVLVLGVGLWWTQRDTPQRLAAEFALQEPGLPVLMGADSRMDAIMNAYKQGDLMATEQLIEQARASSPSNDTLTYFAGIVAMRQGLPARAAEEFAEVDASSVFADRAAYEQAIALLYTGHVAEARTLLEGVSRTHDPQLAGRARDLLDRL